MIRDRVVAVIAAFNEEDRIAATVSAVKKIDGIGRILVVDDGSRDSTGDIAEQAGAQVLRLGENVGKGKALQKAVVAITEEIVLFLDGDLGDCADEAGKVLTPVLSGAADMAIADFPKPKKAGGLGFVKGLGRWGIRRFTGKAMNEPLSGQRAVKTELIKGLNFESGYGLEVGLSIDILKKGCRVIEVPVNMTHRETGRDLAGFIHRGRQFLDIMRVIAKRSLKNPGAVSQGSDRA
ncbi:MAG: glycosyltransferase family 2 protein [Actinobacteria bacterium]|nr:glycosyltransferase family 2 protein [Actinomycetota bacterium]